MSGMRPQGVDDTWLDSLGCERSRDKLSPSDAFDVAEAFNGLQWWLHVDVLKKACDERIRHRNRDWLEQWSVPLPPMPRVKGYCGVVMVNDTHSLLRDALLLPLQWTPHWETTTPPSHSERLPGDLRRLADKVIECVVDPRAHERRWTLRLLVEDPKQWQGYVPAKGREPEAARQIVAEQRDTVNEFVAEMASRFEFSKFDAEWESAWASLTSGLLAAMHGGIAQPNVWATGKWNSEQIQGIDGVKEKVSLAAEWGATSFYLPYQNFDEAKRTRQEALDDKSLDADLGKKWDALQIFPLPETSEARARYIRSMINEPRRVPRADDANKEVAVEKPAELVLTKLTEAFSVEPDGNAPFHDRCDWFLSYSQRKEAERYYYRVLIQPIADKCRNQLDERQKAVIANARFVTIPSTSWVSHLGAMIVRPDVCLVFYTEDDAKLKERKKDIEDALHLIDLSPANLDRLGGGKQYIIQPFQNRSLRNGRSVSEPSAPEHLPNQFLPPLTAVTDHYKEGALIFDVTSGTTRMKFRLASLAKPDDWFLVIDNDFSEKRGRFIPGTEIVELIRAADLLNRPTA